MFDHNGHRKKNMEVILELRENAQRSKALLILANEQGLHDNRVNHQVDYSNNRTKKQDKTLLEVA